MALWTIGDGCGGRPGVIGKAGGPEDAGNLRGDCVESVWLGICVRMRVVLVRLAYLGFWEDEVGGKVFSDRLDCDGLILGPILQY